MINIYLCSEDKLPRKPVTWNDTWFNNRIYRIPDINDKVQELIYLIDGAKYIGKNKIESKFGGVYIEITALSTGCKTAINCYMFPDEIFNCSEVGNNAFTEILKLDRASLYFPECAIPLLDDVENEFMLYTNLIDGKLFHSYMDLYEEVG